MSNGLRQNSKPTVGILMEFNEKWMGGVNYIINLIKVLSFATVSLPKIIVLAREDASADFRKAVNDNPFVEIHYLKRCNPPAGLQGEALNSRIWEHRSNEVRQAVRQYGIDIIFPVIDPRDLDLPTKVIGWIPDFQHRYLPEYFQTSELEQRDRKYNQFAARAKYMIFSSEVALKDFERFYPQYRSKNFVYHFHTILDKNISIKPISYLKEKYGLRDTFIYLPNQFWIHKNHLSVFKAIHQLKKSSKDVQLVCTGSSFEHRNSDYYHQLIRYREEAGLNNILLLGLLPHEEQMQLYYHAHTILQPSLFEGWSSIVEDAKAFQKRILLSDIAVHREQNPSKGIYFNPKNSEDLVVKLSDVLNEPQKHVDYQDLVQQQIWQLQITVNSLVNAFMGCFED